MANVWIARPRDGHGEERLVVLKTILPKFAADPHFQEMFLREGGIAARITHRNVARIFDLGETQGILYIAMEYVDGDPLSKLNRECQKKGVKIPPGVVLRMASDVCAGLHHAHELRDGTGRLLNVVHRDVSPPNVLLTTSGIAKLIDFGIASTHVHSSEETDTGVLKGKAHFMAPEQALGHVVDRRADVWAVGAILYHLLAGRPPYDGQEYLATLRLITSGRPPAALPPEVHPAICAVALKALAYDPARRYETAAQMREAIEDAISKARVNTTNAEVAAFAGPYLTERAARRRQAVEVALAEAAEREGAAPRVKASARPQPVHRVLQSRGVKYAALAAILVGLGAAITAILSVLHPQ
jgi:serine/threonine-protein kinase